MRIESVGAYLENKFSTQKIEIQKDKVEKNEKIDYNDIKDKIEAKLKEIGIKTDNIKNGIKYEKDDEVNKWVVKIYNEKTGEIIQQIPAKEVISVAKGVDELLGNILDKKG